MILARAISIIYADIARTYMTALRAGRYLAIREEGPQPVAAARGRRRSNVALREFCSHAAGIHHLVGCARDMPHDVAAFGVGETSIK